MHNFLADDFLAIGVPKHDVSIETNGDRSLLRIEAIHLGVIGRGQGHKLICGDSSLHHTFAPQYWQPRFDAWDAIRNPPERSARFRTLFTLRAFEIERAMIRRKRLKNPLFNTLPDRAPACTIARRRRADVFATAIVHIETLEILDGERDILWAGFAIDFEPTLLCPANLLHGLTAGHMHDHDGHVEQFGMADCTVRRLTLDGFRAGRCVVERRSLPSKFQTLGHELDRIVSFATNHHQRAAGARA